MRERMEANNAEQRKLAIAFGKPVPPEFLNDIKPVRAYTKREDDDQESLVIQAVSDLLKAHPDVCFAVRQNTGAVQSGDARYWFYRILRAPVVNYDITLTDFWGFRRDGRPFALECKRPSWKGNSLTERESKQYEFIMLCREMHGMGGFCRSAAEAEAILRR